VLVGRTSDADLVINSVNVSRRQAKVIALAEGHELVDLGSRCGTFVNHQRVERHILKHGDRVTFGKDDIEFRFFIDPTKPRKEETTKIVQKKVRDLGRVLPSAHTDLEKMLCVLDFQYQWNQVFTPESGLDQILESALKISGAERAFLLVRKGEQFGYASGMDGKGSRLSESHFHTSRSIVREVVTSQQPVFMVEGIHAAFAEQASIVAMNLRAVACLPLRGIPTDGDAPQILGILYLDSTKAMHSLSGLDEKILWPSPKKLNAVCCPVRFHNLNICAYTRFPGRPVTSEETFTTLK
jgi:hypothetical protein